jgi:hypothetical protein
VDVSCANDEIVLSFVPDATLEQIDAALAAVGAWKKMNIQAAKLWSAGIQSAATCEELQAKIDQLKANPLVLDADVNVIGEPGETTPNDPLYPPPPGQDPNFNGQWNLRRSGVSVAWDTEQGKGDYSTIGVVDEGVETTHSDLRANLWDSQGPRGSHGTRVTGIAAAVTNNQNMLAGLGWNARAVVKTTDWGYMVTMDKLGNLINCSATRPGGIAAINISGIWCKPYYMWWSMESLMNAAVDRGILPVAAMGNDNKELRLYPAGFLRAMAVGATDHFLRDYLTGPEVRVSFPGWWGSNYGNHISVVAPGVDITTTDLHDSYLTHFAGTSAATPHVTGLADLVRSEFQSMGPLDIRHRIEDTASDNVAPNVPGQPDPIPGFDKYTGWGFIKADAAMTSTTASCTISGDRWHIAILPVWPEENPSYAQWQESTWPQRVLPAAPAGGTRLIARIKPYTNDYYTQDQYDTNGRPLLDPVTPYRAYWVKYKNCTGNIRIDAQGAQAGLKTGHRVEFRLWANSQNMVGNPFRSNIQWGDPNIAVRYGHSGTTKTLSQAINDGVISATAYYWNPGTASYVPVIANTGKVMLPYRGYWIRVRGVSFKVHMLAKP